MAMTIDRIATPNTYAKWFSRIAWLGIVFNLLFVATELFAPNLVNVSLGMPVTANTSWNLAHAAMVLGLTVLYIPAAVSPLRFPAYTWLIVLSRLIAVALWWYLLKSTPGFIQCLVPDATFGVLEGILLQLALPQESRINLANLLTALGDLWRGIVASLALTSVRIGLAMVVVIGAAVGYILWYNLLRAEPDTNYSAVEDHYKHGAIGLSADNRIPYWIWKVLPEMFPEKLPGPGGWASLGLIVEDGQDLPIGFAKRTIGYEAVEANCSLCHTTQFRRTPDSKPEIILGGPSNTVDLQSMQRFLYGGAADPRFTASNVIAAINKIHKLGPIDSMLYRFLIIPSTKEGLLEQQLAYSWQNSRPDQGRGRTDTFNPTKINVFHMPDDGTIGTVDLPQVWNQKPREGMYLHWDGNNNNITERNYAAAMAIGATPKSVIQTSFTRVTNFLLTLQPMPYPFAIDKAAAERGGAIFAQNCAGCHAFGGANTGQVTDISTIKTDRHRLDSFTQGLVDKFHAIDSPPFVFDAYRKTDGYANVPLDGIWARAPYLHNGSVPNLHDLLQPEKDRPTTFYRGYDVYDPAQVGFITDGPEAQKVGFLVDTNIPGNSNQGHSYGVTLTEKEKQDLIEFLKTF
jgi:mono/diheme cytochrome c family protein